ncbi:hypothetical protein ACSBR2_026326 [Camellia fascicularis]
MAVSYFTLSQSQIQPNPQTLLILARARLADPQRRRLEATTLAAAAPERVQTSEPSSSSFDQKKLLNRASKVVRVKMPVLAREMVRQYGSSKRWQLIAAEPKLSH